MQSTKEVAPLEAARTECSVLGMSLSNPIIVASGLLTDSSKQIRRAVACGAGAVVTKTIYAGREAEATEKVRMILTGALNSTTYSRHPISFWLTELAAMQRDGLPLIVSLHGETPELLADLAEAVSSVCDYPLELGICCPNDSSYSRLTPELVRAYTKAVKARTPAPFSVKLTAGDGLAEFACAALEAGADALSISDTLPALMLDGEQPQIQLGGTAGYSGPGIKPIVLNSIFELRRRNIDCPVLGIGGIETAKDVLDYIRVGSSAVQVYTYFMRSGIEKVGQLAKDVSYWLARNDTTLGEQIGAALRTEGARRHTAVRGVDVVGAQASVPLEKLNV